MTNLFVQEKYFVAVEKKVLFFVIFAISTFHSDQDFFMKNHIIHY